MHHLMSLISIIMMIRCFSILSVIQTNGMVCCCLDLMMDREVDDAPS